MMLRNLIDEVRSRRVLAFAALGVLVALAVPLLFLKSAPEGAPQATTAAPAAAEEAKLPARAARLLQTTDPGAPAGHAKGSAQDPFSPPASYMAAAAAAAAAKGDAAATPAATASGAAGQTAGGATSDKPVEVVVTNPGTRGTSGDRSGTARPSSSLTARNASVDVRFGPRAETRIRRAIPRQKGFYIHGKLVAVFVKYSPSRNAAVFAVAPGVYVSGAAKCRAQDGACRYVDIPAGRHAWLTVAMPSRTIVSRRLDVVRIKRRTAGSATRAASAGARSEAACLARKLMAMKRGDALLDRDACRD
ncbi:MAG TPA: hypothetical protein VGV90_03040 [Solirubrobacteraceae bacterium]|nr:hypothetical protein [Solirubrobacteraceae bacterium]